MSHPRRLVLVISLFAFIFAFSVSGFAQNFVKDGTFEEGPQAPFGSWTTFPAGSSINNAWLVGGGSVDLHNGETVGGVPQAWNFAAAGGSQAVDLTGGGPSSISQNLPTGAGHYKLRFDMAANMACDPGVRTLELKIGTYSFIENYSYNGSSFTMPWQEHVYEVDLTGPTTITFRSLTGNGCGPAVDNVFVGLMPTGLGRTMWQMYRNEIITSNVTSLGSHGNIGYYIHAPAIPAVDANVNLGDSNGGWTPAPDGNIIGFTPGSRLPPNQCLTSLDFTFFQTLVSVPASTTNFTFSIAFSNMDDGSRVTIINSRYPLGVVDPGSYVFLGGTGTANLGPYVVPGETNRVVITQMDDCYSGNNLGRAEVDLNGSFIPPNSRPAIGAASQQITLNEGGTATNSGSYSDSDTADTVSISASVGTVTHTGTNSGSWSWSNPAPDNANYPVMITANDGKGGLATTSFNVTVNNIPPTAIFSSNPPAVNQGTPFVLSLTNPFDVNADIQAGLQYALDCDDQTGFSAFSSANTRTCSTNPAGNPTRIIRGIVRDKDGGQNQYNSTVSINRPPTCNNSNIILSEDTGPTAWSLAAQCSDPDAGDTITIHVDPISLTNVNVVPTGGGTFAFTASANYNGPAGIITFVAEDSHGLTSSKVVDNVFINPVNDPPVVTAPSDLSLLEGEGSTISLGPLVFDVESPDGDIQWSAASDDAAVSVGINFGNLTVTAESGPATAHITLTATDRGDRNNCSGPLPGCSPALSTTANFIVNVTVPAPPPFSLASPDEDGCICTPVFGVYPSTSAHHWFAKASAATMDITLFAHSVNGTDPETAMAQVYDTVTGLPVGLPFSTSYPAGTLPGGETSVTRTLGGLTVGRAYRIRITIPSHFDAQPHYRLKIEGASELGLTSPTFAGFEEPGTLTNGRGDRWFLNVAPGEPINLRVFSAGTPTPPTYTGRLSVRLIGPVPPFSGAPTVFDTTYTLATPPNMDQTITTGPLAGGVYEAVIDADQHYRLEKSGGLDNGVYFTPSSQGIGSVTGTITRGDGSPATNPVSLQLTPDDGTAAPFNFTVVGSTTFAHVPAGHYHVTVLTNPSFVVIGPSSAEIVVTCDHGASVNFQILLASQIFAGPAVGTYGGNTSLTATLKSGSNPLPGRTVNFTLNGNPVGSAVTNVAGTASLPGVSLSGINAGVYPGAVGASFAGDTIYQGSSGTSTLTVNKRPASVTPNAAGKAWGTADPLLTGTLSGFLASDGVTATYVRGSGEDAGVYVINALLAPSGLFNNYVITPNTAPFTITSTLTTALAGTGSGTISGPGVNCGSDCTENFTSTSTITLLAQPAPGSVFLNWSGDCTGTGTCSLSTAGDHSVTATFATVSTTGRMTGGGSVFTADGTRVTHGMTLQCSTTAKPLNLEINWDRGNNFKLDALTSVLCYDDAAIGPAPPAAGFDTMAGTGTGKLNGQAATIEFKLTDAGEPGVNDTATITIRQGASTVLTVSGKLNNGNQQAHKN